MFGRQFRAAEHRQHVLPPSPSRYGFERLGSSPRNAGQCAKCDGMGRETYEADSGSLSTQTCTACGGTGQAKQSSRRQAKPSGSDYFLDFADWAYANGYDEMDADHLSLYIRDVGLSPRAEQKLRYEFSDVTGIMASYVDWIRPSDLSDEELLGNFEVFLEDDEFDVLILEVKRRGLSDEFESRMASSMDSRRNASSRRTASSLTWIYESPEQSLLGQEGWFANSGDGFHASIFEADDYIQLVPGAQRFDVDIYTDSNNYEHVSVNESGFESVDEAKSFVEGVFGYSRTASRKTAGLSFTEWMSTAYPGKELLDFKRPEQSKILNEYIQDVGEGNEVWSSRTASWDQEYDGTWFGSFPNGVLGWLIPSRDSEFPDTYTVSAEVDRPGDSRVLFTEFNVSLEEGKRMVEEAAAQVTSSRTAATYFGKPSSSSQAPLLQRYSKPSKLRGMTFADLDGLEQFVKAQLEMCPMDSIEVDDVLRGIKAARKWKEKNGYTANRRTAFLDTVELTEPRHRVAGWDWDDHLNGFIAAEAAREFTCACGENVPAPGYTDCRCGKRWNAYNIRANGSQKMIAREVPVRENVVMARTASRKQGQGNPNAVQNYLDWAESVGRNPKDYTTLADYAYEGPSHIPYNGYDSDEILEVVFGVDRSYSAPPPEPEHGSPNISDPAVDEYEIWCWKKDRDPDSRYSLNDYQNENYVSDDDRQKIERAYFRHGSNSHRQAADISELRPGKKVWVGNRQGRVDEVRGDRVTVAFPGGGIDFFRADQVSTIPVSYASLRKIAAPSSGADAIAQHFPGWRVDDDDGDFWEIQSPGGEHAFIHEGNGVYTVLTNDNTPDEFYETGLSFEEALEEIRAEGVTASRIEATPFVKFTASGIPKFREGDMVIGRGPNMNTHTLREVGSVVEQDGGYFYRLRKLHGSGPGGSRLYAEEHLEGYKLQR